MLHNYVIIWHWILISTPSLLESFHSFLHQQFHSTFKRQWVLRFVLQVKSWQSINVPSPYATVNMLIMLSGCIYTVNFISNLKLNDEIPLNFAFSFQYEIIFFVKRNLIQYIVCSNYSYYQYNIYNILPLIFLWPNIALGPDLLISTWFSVNKKYRNAIRMNHVCNESWLSA